MNPETTSMFFCFSYPRSVRPCTCSGVYPLASSE